MIFLDNILNEKALISFDIGAFFKALSLYGGKYDYKEKCE